MYWVLCIFKIINFFPVFLTHSLLANKSSPTLTSFSFWHTSLVMSYGCLLSTSQGLLTGAWAACQWPHHQRGGLLPAPTVHSPSRVMEWWGVLCRFLHWPRLQWVHVCSGHAMSSRHCSQLFFPSSSSCFLHPLLCCVPWATEGRTDAAQRVLLQQSRQHPKDHNEAS